MYRPTPEILAARVVGSVAHQYHAQQKLGPQRCHRGGDRAGQTGPLQRLARQGTGQQLAIQIEDVYRQRRSGALAQMLRRRSTAVFARP